MRLNRLKRQLKKVYLKGFVVVVTPSPLECFHYTEGSKTCLASESKVFLYKFGNVLCARSSRCKKLP